MQKLSAKNGRYREIYWHVGDAVCFGLVDLATAGVLRMLGYTWLRYALQP
ncbi:MAG: hypothetical protein RSD57_18840 [Comamonas sp.]